MKVLVIYGSLSQGSINKALALAMPPKAPEGLELEIIPVPEFPLYSAERETAFPQEVAAFKERIKSADGVLIVTPEYNRGMPGGLKNMLDWTSRPSGQHPWGKKPVGVLGASSGPRGTIVAQYDLKRMMIYFGAHLMGTPEFYVDNSDKKLDGGQLLDEKTAEYLVRYLAAFKEHLARLA